jgi:hypothetical protein
MHRVARRGAFDAVGFDVIDVPRERGALDGRGARPDEGHNVAGVFAGDGGALDVDDARRGARGAWRGRVAALGGG